MPPYRRTFSILNSYGESRKDVHYSIRALTEFEDTSARGIVKAAELGWRHGDRVWASEPLPTDRAARAATMLLLNGFVLSGGVEHVAMCAKALSIQFPIHYTFHRATMPELIPHLTEDCGLAFTETPNAYGVDGLLNASIPADA